MNPAPSPSNLEPASTPARIAAQEWELIRAEKALDDTRSLILQDTSRPMFAQLQRQQQDLEAVVDRMQRELISLKSSTAPIRQLPFDVLGEIVVLVVGVRNRSVVAAIRNLSLVCKFWRKVILRTPRAWTYIPFANDPSAHSGRFLTSTNIFGRWLKRSGSLRVDVLLDFCGTARMDFDCPPLPEDLLPLLMKNIGKLRSLKISMHNPTPTHRTQVYTTLGKSAALRNLENLDLDISHLRFPIVPTNLERKLAAKTSYLRSLHISSFPDLHCRWYPGVSSLRHLHLRIISARVLVDFFVCHGNFSSLRSLRVDDLDDTVRPVTGPATIRSLEVLSLGLRHSGPGDLLDVLYFPGLEVLEFKVQRIGANSNAIQYFETLMKESDPPLRELYLTGFRFFDNLEARLINCLREVPILSKLCIHDAGRSMPRKLLQALSNPVEESWICPELTHVFFGEYSFDQLTEETLARNDAAAGRPCRFDPTTAAAWLAVTAFVQARIEESERAAAEQAGRLVDVEEEPQLVVLRPVRARLAFDEYHPDWSGKWRWTQRHFPQYEWWKLPEHLELEAD